ncbi:mediator complex subunit 15 domain-containing protein [Filimonas effusa]|uniref:Uncharacterized protein n=1 Tax=Filimonas effusa TaxID=2508721 RepID=A0A4Q1D2A6_9BACT|nr:hypothetical protein [Filimonas effusa]RXK81347.1 hypothetical protein ESB13_20645 [Filimonas effusa]
MSGFNFTIPNTLLAGLYKDTLIASDEDAPLAEKPGAVAAVPGQEMRAAAAGGLHQAVQGGADQMQQGARQGETPGTGGMQQPGMQGETPRTGGMQQPGMQGDGRLSVPMPGDVQSNPAQGMPAADGYGVAGGAAGNVQSGQGGATANMQGGQGRAAGNVQGGQGGAAANMQGGQGGAAGNVQGGQGGAAANMQGGQGRAAGNVQGGQGGAAANMQGGQGSAAGNVQSGQRGAAGNAAVSMLGNNAKGIVILVKDGENVHLAEDALQLLSGILAACRLNMGDVAVVNMSRNHFNFSQIRQQLQVNYCFLFDISMQEMQLAFAIPPFQVFQHDSCTFLSAPALQRMLGGSEEAKLLKSKLWLCLKNIFNI